MSAPSGEVLKRLEILHKKLEDQGLYVGASTAWLAIDEIKRLRYLEKLAAAVEQPRAIALIQCGDEVLVDGEWYPVSGLSLSSLAPVGASQRQITTGSVFTLKPIGKFEPCLGYRLDYGDIEQVRRP